MLRPTVIPGVLSNGWHNCIPKVGVTMAQVDQARAIYKKRVENGDDDDGGNLNSFQ